jgi:hypothetical protein
VAGGGGAHALSADDLSHGHVFAVDPRHRPPERSSWPWGAGAAGRAELGVVFHAKEHPADLERPVEGGGRGGFDTSHPAYRARNLVWLASSNTVYVWRPPLHTRWEGLLQLGTEVRAALPAAARTGRP